MLHVQKIEILSENISFKTAELASCFSSSMFENYFRELMISDLWIKNYSNL